MPTQFSSHASLQQLLSIAHTQIASGSSTQPAIALASQQGVAPVVPLDPLELPPELSVVLEPSAPLLLVSDPPVVPCMHSPPQERALVTQSWDQPTSQQSPITSQTHCSTSPSSQPGVPCFSQQLIGGSSVSAPDIVFGSVVASMPVDDAVVAVEVPLPVSESLDGSPDGSPEGSLPIDGSSDLPDSPVPESPAPNTGFSRLHAATSTSTSDGSSKRIRSDYGIDAGPSTRAPIPDEKRRGAQTWRPPAAQTPKRGGAETMLENVARRGLLAFATGWLGLPACTVGEGGPTGLSASVGSVGSGSEGSSGAGPEEGEGESGGHEGSGACGDAVCVQGENCMVCPEDCGDCDSFCGDASCDADESCSKCPDDCGACPLCGDDVCSGDETCTSCVADCGTCNAACGDGVCVQGETCDSCPEDCDACAPGCPDGVCGATETCSSCEPDCGACASVCGDAICAKDEGCSDCPDDCGECAPACGDDECNGGESCTDCPEDCGACTCPCNPGVAGFDNFCDWPPSTTGCPMTDPGGYCDPRAPYADYEDGNWEQGWYEYQAQCA